MLAETRTLLNETSSSNSSYTDQVLNDGMNMGYLLACAKAGLNQSIATASGVASQQLYALPADLLRLIAVKYNDPDTTTTDWVDLTIMDVSALGRLYPSWENDVAGIPTVAYRAKRTVIGLYPKPKTAGTSNIKLYYVERPTKLAAGSDIPDLPEEHHILPCYYSAFRALMIARDPSAGGFKTLFEQGLNQMEVEQAQSTDDPAFTWG